MQIEKQYDQIAKAYSDICTQNNAGSSHLYFNAIDFDLSQKKLLDLGCGNGRDFHYFFQKGAIVHGIDASQEMLKIAKQHCPSAILKESVLDKIPYPDMFFDIVVSKWSFHYAQSINRIYQEIHRVLKPNGYFMALMSHPVRQFMERKIKPRDYFYKGIVETSLFNNQIKIKEHAHTINDYLSSYFLQHFNLTAYQEGIVGGNEKISDDIYPIYLMIKAIRK